jgi:hypothetical protein
MSSSDTLRPENIALTARQKEHVTTKLRRKRFSCGSCGSEDFVVGDALYLGFLFLNEEQGTYMVALTCTNTACPAPRTGIRLHEASFLGSPTAASQGESALRRAGVPAGGPDASVARDSTS